MKFDRTGNRVIPETSDRAGGRIQREMTPVELQYILDRADSGDPSDLCRLAQELEERNWDIRNSLETRVNALLGCGWDILPPPDRSGDAHAEMIAQHFAEALRNAGNLNEYDTFQELLGDLSGAVIAPYAVSEIIWDGAELAGFRSIEGRHFTFLKSREPRLVTTDHPEGMELPPYKFIFHRNHRTGSELCRGGLIRTLAWLHCFQSYPLKDFLAYAERFGMPFLIAKLDRTTYEKDRSIVQNAIRNFGPRGGGVFSKNMELELLQAASGGENVYKTLLSYTSDAITKVILGQLASSSRSSGLSGGDAQTRVRQDILEADARKMESTIRAQLAAPWTAFHYGSGAPVPHLRFRVEPPEDLAAFASMLASLHSAGFTGDPDEIGRRFGLHLVKRTTRASLRTHTTNKNERKQEQE